MGVSTKIRNEVVDYDYLDDLSKQDLAFLRKFTDEYYQGSFQHDNPLHKSLKAQRGCYLMNNCRNRDVYAIAKVTQKLVMFNTNPKRENKAHAVNPSDSYPALIDIKANLINFFTDNPRHVMLEHMSNMGYRVR